MASINNIIHQAGQYRLAEHIAAAAITPGMLVELISAGTIQPHSTSGGFGERAIALENPLKGDTNADAYAIGDPVQVGLEIPGSVVQLLCRVGYNYTIGTKLISYGDGTFIPTTGTPKQIFATVVTANDLTASGSVTALVSARIQ